MINVDNTESTLKELGLKYKRVKVGYRLHIGFHLNSEDWFLLKDKMDCFIFKDEKTAEETAKLLEQQYKEYYKEDKPDFQYMIYELVETVYFK